MGGIYPCCSRRCRPPSMRTTTGKGIGRLLESIGVRPIILPTAAAWDIGTTSATTSTRSPDLVPPSPPSRGMVRRVVEYAVRRGGHSMLKIDSTPMSKAATGLSRPSTPARAVLPRRRASLPSSLSILSSWSVAAGTGTAPVLIWPVHKRRLDMSRCRYRFAGSVRGHDAPARLLRTS